MCWEIWIALIIAIPVILFPAAYLGYINIGVVFSSIKEARVKHLVCKNVTEDPANINTGTMRRQG